MSNAIACRHIATIPNGKSALLDNYPDNSRVYHDGKIYVYDTSGMSLEAFRGAVAVAFDAEDDGLDVEEWGASNIYRADVF